MKKIIMKYLVVFLPLILGTLSSLYINTNIETLTLPPFYPPNYIFGVVWSILYLIMGISIYLNRYSKRCIFLFTIQLIINLSWPFIFFNLKYYGISIFIMMLLLITVLIMLLCFYEKKKATAIINIPYFIWILIAFYLNCGIYFLN